MVDTSGDVNPNGTPPPPQSEPTPPPTGDDTGTGTRNDVPDPVLPLRNRRTHISEHISGVLRALPLSLKLSRNKKIENENLARVDRDTNHQIDPIAFPEPGSPQASVISLTEEDEANLRNPSIAHKLFDLMPQYIISWLAAEDARVKELKRKHDESLKDPVSVAEDRVAKRRCMQGTQLTLRDPLALASFTLPQIMFDTENLVAIPLSFFTQKNLRYIIDDLASLPTKKVNSCSGDLKAMYILDIEKLMVKLGTELSMDFGSYLQAADQYYKFQLQRSADKEWGDIWSAHFRFFDTRPDAAELFPAWMHAEHKMRRDTRTYHQRYLISDYEAAYNHSVIEHKQRTSAQADISKLNVEMAQMREHMARMSKSSSSSPFSGFNSPVGARSLLSASYVQRSAIPSPVTPGIKSQLSFLMGKMRGHDLSMADSSPPTTRRSASASTSGAPIPLADMEPPVSTSAPSAVPSPTTPSHLHAVQELEDFLSVARPPRLAYPDFTAFIARRPSFSPSLHVLPDVFARIIMPYSASAFRSLLIKHDLLSSYPLLVYNLEHGFPLGPMPSLNSTYILKNHPSCLNYPDEVSGYLHEEVSAGRMSSPFSKDVIELILRGPFQSSPLIVAVQPQGPGEPDKIRICRNLSKATKDIPSVNSFIKKSDFPTRFDCAARVADIV
ncbi:hypothetical protein CVT25_014420 [Psilocybe cyanescens]|uniref:Uncharacterized protein n=1 Tax=Psilocybe cyanescens TaxID=93625 RepID=A0A409XAF8_PSICY|nr:hypothetical protein CVT25_014420 [Psilocybe cyanescens]